MSGLDVEMGVEEKMPAEDQHGGYSHPTTHNCSTDPPTPSGILLTNCMTSSVGIGAWQQVLVSITLPPSSRIPPRSRLDLAVWLLQVTGLFSTLLPEGVLSAEGEDAQAVNSS